MVMAANAKDGPSRTLTQLMGLDAANKGGISTVSEVIKNTELEKVYVGSKGLFGWPDDTIAQIYRSVDAPSGIQQTLRIVTAGKGDNTTFIGVASASFEVRDKNDVTALNKGVLYALQLRVCPIVARNHVPYDDVDGITINNITGVYGARGTDAIFISQNVSAFGDHSTGVSQWHTVIAADCNVDVGIQFTGKIASYGIDFANANLTTTGIAMRLPNNSFLYQRNALDTGDRRVVGMDANNVVQLGGANVSGVKANNWFGEPAPTVVSGTTYTVGFNDSSLIFTNPAGCTVTLPSTSLNQGRILSVKTTQAAAIVSAGSDVVPLAGGSAGSAILSATAGKWAELRMDGSNVWQIVKGN